MIKNSITTRDLDDEYTHHRATGQDDGSYMQNRMRELEAGFERVMVSVISVAAVGFVVE